MMWWIGLGFVGAGMLLMLSKLVVRLFNRVEPVKLKDGARRKFAVIIPARDESKVIGRLLESIAVQSEAIDFKDVYVVVERKGDPTVKIAESYGAQVFVRKNVAKRKRKGYALGEVIEMILVKKKRYDAYFFFDADNVVGRSYFREMRKLYERGYDIGIGRRRTLNPTTVIAVGSGLIFTIVNGILNRCKMKRGMNCIVSGTGFYIAGRVIKEMGTYPFHSLTEDYELSVYATVHGLTTGYSQMAVFYDEQPETFGEYFKQRTRWVKGYFEARRNFRGQLVRELRLGNGNVASVYDTIIGVYDLVLMVIGVLIWAVAAVFTGDIALNLFGVVLLVYLVLAVFTGILLSMEWGQLDDRLKVMVIMVHPWMLLSYVGCLVAAFMQKELEWKPIIHGDGVKK
ncbi:glycosyltransferase [Candidatus Saccharibacteria bacterium]|nr:glycosyltransferase [Candidatus Saccharibacteria bacterium]